MKNYFSLLINVLLIFGVLTCSINVVCQTSITNLYGALARIDTSYSLFTFDPGEVTIQDEETSYHINGVAYRDGYYYVVRSRPDDSNDEKLLIISESDHKVVQTMALDLESIHPGGIQIYDNILVVPFENDDEDSKLCFYNLEDPTSPTLAGSFTVSGISNAICAGITEYDGNYLVAQYYSRSGYVRFFLLDSSFDKITSKTWRAPNDTIKTDWYPLNDWPNDTYNYESMNLVKTDSGYFMLMYHSTNGIDVYSINDPSLTTDLDLNMVYRLSCSPYGKGFRYGAGMTITDSENVRFYSVLKHVFSDQSDNVISLFEPQADWPWMLSYKYDTGGQVDVAVNEGNNCIEMHFGSPGGSKAENLYTRVGSINLLTNEVEWGSSTNIGAVGSYVATSLLDNNYCIELHVGTSTVTSSHYYSVGEMDTTAKSISWGDVTKYDTGGQIAVATDNNNHIIEVHRGREGGSNENNHFYMVGSIDTDSKSISWGSSSKFGSGGFISLALDNNGNCVELHRGEPDSSDAGNLYYRVGSVDFSSSSITWGDEKQFDTGGDMDIALNDDNNIIEVHRGKGSTTQYKNYYRFGSVNTSSKTISWDDNVVYNKEAGNVRVDMNNNDNAVEIHLGSEEGDYSNVHYCRTIECGSATSLKALFNNTDFNEEKNIPNYGETKIYPNPSKDNIFFEINTIESGDYVIQIIDLSGRIVLTKELGYFAKGQEINNMIRLESDILAGSYLFTVKQSGIVKSVTKLLVQ